MTTLLTPEVIAATRRLRAAERACQDIPLWPPWRYRHRMATAMREWDQANLALFDAQVKALGLWP